MPLASCALTILHAWVQSESLRKHCYAVADSMRHFAQVRGEDVDLAPWPPSPILLAGNSAKKPGTLTINSALTFNSLSTYKCVLNRSTPIAGKVSALGVTINSNVPFTFVEVGTGTLAAGTVFTVINNTSANPIFGTFSNLANGSTFISNGNNFKASYTGGTGNDLTLTVQ